MPVKSQHSWLELNFQ